MRVSQKQLAATILFLLLQANAVFSQKITIAVLDLEGVAVSQPEAVALSNRLRNELFRLQAYKVVTRGLMEEILSEQDFQQTGCTSDECLVTVGKLLGVQQMVGGSISKIGSIYSVSVMVVDVETGEILKVSDLDIEGRLEKMLTEGMKRVAAQIAGMEINPVAKVVPRITYAPAKPVSARPRFQKVDLIEGKYYIGGKLYTRPKVIAEIIKINDPEVTRLAEEFRIIHKAYGRNTYTFFGIMGVSVVSGLVSKNKVSAAGLYAVVPIAFFVGLSREESILRKRVGVFNPAILRYNFLVSKQ